MVERIGDMLSTWHELKVGPTKELAAQIVRRTGGGPVDYLPLTRQISF
jgi:hypothetical protein